MDDEARRLWAIPSMSGELDGMNLALLDPAEEDERRILIEAEHPELARALRSGRRELRVAGQTINPVLHVALHQVVAQQIWDDDPRETWLTAQRLTKAGHDRHKVLHMLMSVVGEDIRRAIAGEPQRSQAEVAEAFAALPDC